MREPAWYGELMLRSTERHERIGWRWCGLDLCLGRTSVEPTPAWRNGSIWIDKTQSINTAEHLLHEPALQLSVTPTASPIPHPHLRLPQSIKMMTKTAITALLMGSALASPIFERQETATTTASETSSTSEAYDWSAEWVTEFPIHESCNSTLRNQLSEALAEAQQLAQHAKDHLLRWGHESEFVTKYFGDGNTATPIGWYERVISADKKGMLFRCDDPDKNCATQDSKFTSRNKMG